MLCCTVCCVRCVLYIYVIAILYYCTTVFSLQSNYNPVPQSNQIKSTTTDGKYIKHRMFRESCLLVEGNYLKDLNVLGRDLSQAVLVDNSPHAFGYQINNGIPIESWFDDPNDTELLKLEQFCSTLHGVKDVRTMVRSKFQTYKLIRDA
jgi:TFIIF-interacting CTD phosphatase-like protein